MKVNITIALVLMCISTLQPTGGADTPLGHSARGSFTG